MALKHASRGLAVAPSLRNQRDRRFEQCTRLQRPRRVFAVSSLPAAVAAPVAGAGVAVPAGFAGAVASAWATLKAGEESLFCSVSHGLTALVSFGLHAAVTPWLPGDVWFVLAWTLGVKPALKSLAAAWAWARGRLAPPFETTVFGRLLGPLSSLGWCFVALWTFDNGLVLCERIGLVSEEPTAFVKGFPFSCYTLWIGGLVMEVQRRIFMRMEGPVGNNLMLERAVGLCTIVVTAIVAASFVGVHARTLLAFGGLAGFATGLAIKDVLTNLFGGLSLLVQRQFLLGDKVSFKQHGLVTVAKLGYLQTVLRLADSSLLYVPNGTFISAEVQNSSRTTLCRLSGNFSVRYADAPKLGPLLEALTRTLRGMPQFAADEEWYVKCGGFGTHGPIIKVEALFHKGALKREELITNGWLAVERVVREQGCEFADQAERG